MSRREGSKERSGSKERARKSRMGDCGPQLLPRDRSGRLILPPTTSPSTHLFFSWGETSIKAHQKRLQRFGSQGELQDEEPPELLCEIPVCQNQLIRLQRQLPLGSSFADWGPSVAVCDQVIEAHRSLLRAGCRVVELGCGVGLPSLVCASLGARVIATDLPGAIEDVEKNCTINGWPQAIWHVVGSSEGVPVTRERGGMIEKERLSQDALVEEVELMKDHNIMHYRRLTGTGPAEGWVQLVRPYGNRPLCVKTELRPPAQRSYAGDFGRGTIVVTPLRWNAQDGLELMKRLDEMEAAALELSGNDKALKPAPPHLEPRLIPNQVMRPDGFPNLADIVLCSDCVCEPAYGESWEELVETIESILAPEGHVIISLRRRSHDGVERFVQRLGRNLRYERFKHRKSNPGSPDGVDLICASWPGKREQFEDSVDSPRNPRETDFAKLIQGT
mmetsp:Transcript_66866/g.157555  ORF Transcript_66866/g.157555 Transcript_66866/m.157555 type:complete len:447 (+) Transcript_66866:100-1440(+)